MVKYLTLFLLFTFSFAEKLPCTYKQLSHPLYNSCESIESLSDIEDIEKLSSVYLKELDEVKKLGHSVDKRKRKEESKVYLSRLRVLQKKYNHILYKIHKNISKAIDKDDYKLFSRLTAYKFDGLLKSSALYAKSLAFYEKNKKDKKIDFFEKKIQDKKIEDATTQEFFNVATTEVYDSRTRNTSKRVRLEAVENKGYISIYIENLNPYTITLNIKEKIRNFDYNSLLKKEFPLKSHVKKEYMRLYKKRGAIKLSYSFSYTWIIGSIDAVHDDSHIYRLPFAKSTSHRVTQGYNGKYTHKGHSQYAIDFGMNIGTKVYAVRDGVVAKLKEDSNKGGIGRKFSKYGNYVTIEHSDSTFATYYHLKKNGVVPRVGDKIQKGDFIAYSGNTGYSSGPHLHLAVFKASSATRTKTIPIQFLTEKGVLKTPIQGLFYTAK